MVSCRMFHNQGMTKDHLSNSEAGIRASLEVYKGRARGAGYRDASTKVRARKLNTLYYWVWLAHQWSNCESACRTIATPSMFGILD